MRTAAIKTQTIQLPYNHYQAIKEEIELLKNNTLLLKFNKLIDLLYQEKYGLYMNDYTEDLTEISINNSWKDEQSVWDKL